MVFLYFFPREIVLVFMVIVSASMYLVLRPAGLAFMEGPPSLKVGNSFCNPSARMI